MACRNAYKARIINNSQMEKQIKYDMFEPVEAQTVSKLLFGVDSNIRADTILQNNISEFEWVLRNKIYPNFWGRNILGENAITNEEIVFLHSKGCKIAAMYTEEGETKTEEQGKAIAEKLVRAGDKLKIPGGTAIFLQIKADNEVTRNFLRGFARELLFEGYTPGFRANTDAKYGFDREYSRGIQTDAEIFKRCLIWADSPTLIEYDRITTTHLIHPDNWIPFAPSGITRNQIAVWQYGKECHPIESITGEKTFFNINLVRNTQVIIEKMF